MPSFRATLQITGLRPGHAPEEVMDMAVAAVGAAHVVEANQLDIVAGTPRITVRFMVEASEHDAENQFARNAAVSMAHGVNTVASSGALRTYRRQTGKWLAI
ncbi:MULTISPECIES: hypothetical protein [Arthrobacter]|uniref:Uncharacterized protein n=1 Tax=Arthrobacter psychrochitiniphilus TaxID=291045 RepID=A0A2V3DVS3_9MICC|nr:hypothetical protein [Arthrobacter psychrochitiniphilus]NYG15809.1 hypothetical protein [Arthrobacter psychrochitiniphilus]PXA66741.1 hypothetical protein CVS29_03985 [Arthrobacter psychrochitiniphilus]